MKEWVYIEGSPDSPLDLEALFLHFPNLKYRLCDCVLRATKLSSLSLTNIISGRPPRQNTTLTRNSPSQIQPSCGMEHPQQVLLHLLRKRETPGSGYFATGSSIVGIFLTKPSYDGPASAGVFCLDDPTLTCDPFTPQR